MGTPETLRSNLLAVDHLTGCARDLPGGNASPPRLGADRHPRLGRLAIVSALASHRFSGRVERLLAARAPAIGPVATAAQRRLAATDHDAVPLNERMIRLEASMECLGVPANPRPGPAGNPALPQEPTRESGKQRPPIEQVAQSIWYV